MTNDFLTYNDADLVRMMKSGDAGSGRAFAELYRRYSPKVHAYCAGMIQNRDQAEDIFQETFIRFFDNIHPESRETNIGGYLMITARNLCINYLRSLKQVVTIDELSELIAESTAYETDELYNLVINSLDLLDMKYKEAFILREIEGLAYKEIADVCGLTETNAKSRVQRAREKLINILQPYLKDLIE